jgi:hypothetical protein
MSSMYEYEMATEKQVSHTARVLTCFVLISRKDMEARKKNYSSLTPYYARRKLTKKVRPRKESPLSALDGSSGGSMRKKARRDYSMSIAAVHDLQMENMDEDSRCCSDDCLNAVMTTKAIHKRRFAMGLMDQQTKRNFLVNEISSFAIVNNNRYASSTASQPKLVIQLSTAQSYTWLTMNLVYNIHVYIVFAEVRVSGLQSSMDRPYARKPIAL